MSFARADGQLRGRLQQADGVLRDLAAADFSPGAVLLECVANAANACLGVPVRLLHGQAAATPWQRYGRYGAGGTRARVQASHGVTAPTALALARAFYECGIRQ